MRAGLEPEQSEASGEVGPGGTAPSLHVDADVSPAQQQQATTAVASQDHDQALEEPSQVDAESVDPFEDITTILEFFSTYTHSLLLYRWPTTVCYPLDALIRAFDYNPFCRAGITDPSPFEAGPSSGSSSDHKG